MDCGARQGDTDGARNGTWTTDSVMTTKVKHRMTATPLHSLVAVVLLCVCVVLLCVCCVLYVCAFRRWEAVQYSGGAVLYSVPTRRRAAVSLLYDISAAVAVSTGDR